MSTGGIYVGILWAIPPFGVDVVAVVGIHVETLVLRCYSA